MEVCLRLRKQNGSQRGLQDNDFAYTKQVGGRIREHLFRCPRLLRPNVLGLCTDVIICVSLQCLGTDRMGHRS